MRRLCIALGLAGCGLLTTGCAIVSPAPLWEVVKATAGVGSMAMAYTPPQASNTIYRLLPPMSEVCIEFNPQTQVPDMVPALQAELRSHGVDSRVYDHPAAARGCPVWLAYAASLDWGLQPFSAHYQPYISGLQLSLRQRNGQLLSSSEYQLDGRWRRGQWTDTRTKLAPVVAALLTGFQD